MNSGFGKSKFSPLAFRNYFRFAITRIEQFDYWHLIFKPPNFNSPTGGDFREYVENYSSLKSVENNLSPPLPLRLRSGNRERGWG
jgi:hypothetical protein